MSAISNNNIAHAIYLASKDKSHTEHALLPRKVVEFLARRRLLSKAPDILSRLNKIINEEEGKLVAKVFSKEVLNENTKREIINSLSKRYGGKNIILEESLNDKLVGGFKIEIGDEVIDLTIKNRIKKLQEYLTRNYEH
ncbi:MAG: F0F1 ATP synthase subunit delta [Candidatus Paceibacterota bacterium]